MIIADTDILIDFLSGKDPGHARVRAELEHGRLRITAISRFELLAGRGSPKQERRIRELLAALPVLPLDASAADLAAAARQLLDERGEPIGTADALIAGIVLANGGTLLTRNQRHFERVEGLRLAAP